MALGAVAALGAVGIARRRVGGRAVVPPARTTADPGRIEVLRGKLARVYKAVFGRAPEMKVEDMGAEGPDGGPILSLLVEGSWEVTPALGTPPSSDPFRAARTLRGEGPLPPRWGWSLRRVIYHPGTRWEPPSEEFEEFEEAGWQAADSGVIYALVCDAAGERASAVLSEIQWQEVMDES